VEFAQLLQEAADKGYCDVFNLTKASSVYLSFIKGWGPEYHQQAINNTPCWLEIQMHRPLVWLDKVLSQMSPTTMTNSK